MQKANTNNIFGIICILLDGFAVALMYASCKMLYAELSSNQVVFFFKTMVLVMLCPWVFSKGLKAIITPHLPLHILRGFLSLTGSLCFMYGLKKVDMISATTIGMLEQILWVIIGIVVFNEKLTRTKVLAVITSLAGAFLVINPGILEENGSIKLLDAELNVGFAFIIASVIIWACNSTVIKLLGQRATSKAQAFYVALFSSIFAYPAAFVVWDFIPTVIGISLPVPIRLVSFSEAGVGYEHMSLITLTAACYLVHILAHFGALKFGEFSVVMPFVYFKAVFAGLFGYLLFNEVVKQGFFIGFAMIVLAGIALIRSEARRRRKQSFLEEQERLPKTL